MKFNISIVTTHGKLYGKWNKIGEGYFEKEFNQVWKKVIQQAPSVKVLKQETDDNTSESESSDEDNAFSFL